MAAAKELNRSYTIPLRREFLKVPKYQRAKKATTAVKQFLAKHMKSEDVRLDASLNEKVWGHGMRNPPSKVKVNVTKDKEGVVRAELFAAAKETKKAPAKKAVKKAAPKVAAKKEAKEAPAEEVKAEEAKVEAKEEKAEAKSE